MTKNNRKNKGLQHKKQTADKSQNAVIEPTQNPISSEQDEVQIQPSEIHKPQVLLGVMNVDLYERLLKPAFVCYAQQQNDEPLRQLVESIVTSIALSEDQEKYRKINDISQRYLYYLERVSNDSVKKWDLIVSQGMCQYWRTQIFMMLIRNSADIFNLLLPEHQESDLPVFCCEQQQFLNGIDEILKSSLNHHSVIKEGTDCSILYDFSRGISYPWLGYDPEIIFNSQGELPEDSDKLANTFALMSENIVNELKPSLIKQIENTLFIDLIYTQFKKIYEDLCQAFEPDEPIPDEMIEMLNQRIRFDQNYQKGFDTLIHGQVIDQKLHRSSRLDIQSLNTFGSIFNIFRYASENHLGVYLFYC